MCVFNNKCVLACVPQVEISTVPGPFGEGLLVSSVDGRAMVTATDQANPIFRDVLTSVFNNSLLLDITLTTHNTHVFYFVKVSVIFKFNGDGCNF